MLLGVLAFAVLAGVFIFPRFIVVFVVIVGLDILRAIPFLIGVLVLVCLVPFTVIFYTLIVRPFIVFVGLLVFVLFLGFMVLLGIALLILGIIGVRIWGVVFRVCRRDHHWVEGKAGD